MSVDNLPVFKNFPAEKEQNKLVKWLKNDVYAPISNKVNWLLAFFTPTDDGEGGEFAPGFGPVSYIDFDITYMDGQQEGRLQWNIDDGTLEVGMPGGSVNLQIGQEMLVRVTNDTVSQIDNGTPVYISGATGTNIKVTPADADFAGGVGLRTFAVATEDIAAGPGGKGYVTTQGFVRDIDTTFAAVAGLPAYVASGGGFTTTKPTAPDISYIVGIVTVANSATAGEMYVIQTSIPNLSSLSDVSTVGIIDASPLQWNSTENIWEPLLVWADAQTGFSGARVPAANAPTWSTFVGNLKSYAFGVNDLLDFDPIELQHDYKVGSDFELHMHWATNGLEGTDSAVNWEIEYSIADMGNPTTTGVGDAFPATTVVTMEQTIPANTPDRTHMYLDLSDITTGTFSIGALIEFRIRRIAAIGTAPAADPFGLMVGVHYMADTSGSRTEYTK